MVFFLLSLAGSIFAQQAYRLASIDLRLPETPLKIGPMAIDEKALTNETDVSLKKAIKKQAHSDYWSWLNSKGFVARFDQDEERKNLRKQWEEFLVVDIFMPYFKLKELEDFVSDKTRVNLFSMKGKAHFNESKKQVEYTFKKKF